VPACDAHPKCYHVRAGPPAPPAYGGFRPPKNISARPPDRPTDRPTGQPPLPRPRAQYTHLENGRVPISARAHYRCYLFDEGAGVGEERGLSLYGSVARYGVAANSGTCVGFASG
jgi:hypothetical protein